MSSNPLVSGIIVFLNEEKFLQEAIESVFAQSYDNWELLLVDDGSTDGSTEIASRYAERHPGRARYLEHEGHQNRGKSASRNLGVRNAKGEFISFLDADDIWLPHKLTEQVAILRAHPEAAMLYGRTRFWFSWSGNPERDYLTDLGVDPDTQVKPPALLSLILRQEHSTPSTCSVMLRREIFDAVGGFGDDFRDMHEDLVLYAKIFLKAPVFVASQCWDHYRQHPPNSCAMAIKTGYFDPDNLNPARLRYLRWIENYLSERGVTDGEVWRVLQRELRPYRHPFIYRLIKRAQCLVKRELKIRELTAWIRELEQGKAWLEEQRGNCQRLAEEREQVMLKRQAWIAELERGKAWLEGELAKWQRPAEKREEVTPEVRHSFDVVRFGDLRRVEPISEHWGFDRGLPLDRYYIEKFLALHSDDIRGRVLEIGDDSYTKRFGGDRVTKSDVLDIEDSNPKVTIVADLTSADHVPSESFDCAIFTQTLQFIYDARTAVRTLHRILKPGGVLLATLPGISQTADEGWYWGFTSLSARKLFGEVFPASLIRIESFGNVLTAVSFLHGLAVKELRQDELDHHDPEYAIVMAVRAVKPESRAA